MEIAVLNGKERQLSRDRFVIRIAVVLCDILCQIPYLRSHNLGLSNPQSLLVYNFGKNIGVFFFHS